MATAANVPAVQLDEARAELDESGERQREIVRLIAIENQKLEAYTAERKNKGRGRPNMAHTAKVAAAEGRIAGLQRGVLPSDPVPNMPEDLVHHCQHYQIIASKSAMPSKEKKRPRSDGAREDDLELELEDLTTCWPGAAGNVMPVVCLTVVCVACIPLCNSLPALHCSGCRR